MRRPARVKILFAYLIQNFHRLNEVVRFRFISQFIADFNPIMFFSAAGLTGSIGCCTYEPL